MDLNYNLQELIFNYSSDKDKMKLINGYIFNPSISINYLINKYKNYIHIQKNSEFMYLIQRIHRDYNICQVCDIYLHYDLLIKFNIGCEHRFICYDCYWDLDYCDECNDNGYGCQICLTNVCKTCNNQHLH